MRTMSWSRMVSWLLNLFLGPFYHIKYTAYFRKKKPKLILWKVLEIVLFRYIRFELVITHALWNLFWVYVGIVFLQDQVKIYGLMANIKEIQKPTVLKYFHGNEKNRILFDVTQCNCIRPIGKKYVYLNVNYSTK